MLLSHLGELIVNILYHFNIAILPQGLFNQGVEGFHLPPCGQGERAAQQLLRKALLQVLGVLGIIEGTVNIARAVRKCREQETGVRQSHHPVPDAVPEGIFSGIIAQTWL